MSTAAGPPSKPPRSALTTRDIIGALAVLVLLVLLAGGVMRSCAFAPGGPVVDSSRLPVVDAPAELARLAPGVPFPVRVPALPPEWRANSVDQAAVPEGGRAVRAGYLTPGGKYLRLQQTDAGEEALLRSESGTGPFGGQGVVELDGQRWVVYTGERGEPIWITEVPGATPVRMLVTGSGDDAEIRVLATAAVRGQVLPAQ